MNTEAAPVKDGYTLVPVSYSKTGVDVSSPFILTTPAKASIGEIADMLSIDGQPKPAISQNDEKEFVITPAVTLLSNSLYIFRLTRDEKEDLTWAFQTAKKFQIVSSFPHNEATNVPKNSGIEITFSSEEYTRIDEYFSISPAVEGRFEYHKDTAVFVPKSLEYKTVYTITIKAGIKLEGTSDELLTDYIFAFETEPAPDYKPVNVSSYDSLSFNTRYVELPSTEPARVQYRVYHRGDETRPIPKINVYKFSGVEQAVNAVDRIMWAPYWSRYAREDSLIDTRPLNQVTTFEVADLDERTYYAILEFPDKLTQGFYLVDATYGNSRDQIIIQISDLPVQIIADNEESIIWVNDVNTGKGSAGATVYDNQDGKTYRTDDNGVAKIDRAITAERSERFTVTSTDGKTCVWLYVPDYSYYYYGGGYRINPGNANEAYWKFLQLDRTLFKNDDTVSFFGFVQDRKGVEVIDNVTAVLTKGGGYYATRDILHKQIVPVQNGGYSDEIKLPNLDSGSYCLTVYHGDIVLNSIYFNVQDYVKPPYRIDVSADKKAVFADDTVTFTAKAGFFEGTPVSELDISYRIPSYYPYRLITSGNGQAKTDINGVVEVSEKIVPSNRAQGQTTLSFIAEATLPEIGRTTKSTYVRVFINDIEMRSQVSRTGRDATIKVDVNSITLDRINDGTAMHYYDYRDKPVARKDISVDIFRVYYERTVSGDYYDYIEKKVVPRYYYTERVEEIDHFNIVTDQNGKAEKAFTLPNRDGESYYAVLSCKDNKGREISQKVYIGRDYSYYYSFANSNDYYLDGIQDSYDIGEEVNLTLKRGTDTVTKGNFLFVTMQRGIQSYQTGRNPYSFEFTVKDMPNTTVYAYYFDGFKYQSNYNMSANIRFDYSKNDLTLTAVTDKETYKPGDACTITVTAQDMDGNAKVADINISIVDEALFALKDYTVDTLTALYSNISSGLRFASATHRAYITTLDAEVNEEALGAEEAPMAMYDSSDSGSDDDTYIREVFKDTAFFSTIRTNAQGEAVYTFQLPDNITSWRLTSSGISNDLYAGNSTQNIIVTNPMFLSYSLNDEFLIGDVPVIGVNVYGTGLTGGETVNFEVWDESAPDVKYTASGVSFERVNIPLWEMKNEGSNALIVKATVSNGTSDAVRHQYQVLRTHREIDVAVYYDVTTNTVYDVSNGGLTNITFTDRSRGAFLYQLTSMRYAYGDRVEKLLVRREANRILKEYFPNLNLYDAKESFNIKKYQRGNGGLAILPHADSDLETTVKIMPYVMNEVNVNSLKNYLYSIYEGENSDNKMCALYGLAMLKEPVLLELDNYALLDDLPVKDMVYIALGYCALGEYGTASEMYDSAIAPKLEKITPYYRVYTGVDNDDILEATSAANTLAAMLEKPEREGLYTYCINNYTTDILINVEKLSYIERELAKRTNVSGSITYTLFGEEYTRELRNGGSYTLRIPAQSIGEFRMLEVSGDVGAVSIFKQPMIEIGEIDNDVTVRRRYYKADEYTDSSYTFEQGDLVRVQIWIDYTKKAIDGAYCVTDYLPAGLEYVSGSVKISGASSFGYGYYRYCTVEGQRVMFYDYNGRFNRGYLYYYYARVISPGTFMAEGPMVQNLNAKDVYTVGEDDIIVINR